MHGMDTSNPDQPKIVHAFIPRDSSGYKIKETWDVLGMRATRSDDTVLENVFIPDRTLSGLCLRAARESILSYSQSLPGR